ncbi:MAG TPA: ATP-binding cassette domain-containing protein, partial [Candidatus Pullichristensenella excrementigallinarum]|nr:ATP-binding cassette domain-containing protein [Candidatus Pullichristensenella excrementigallinarum]
MLEVRDVVKRYQGKTAVNHMTLSMEEGQLIALLGPNGSGKTTLMKMIAGLVKPTSGEILLEGNPVGAREKRRIAYMPTEAYFYNYMTALDAGKYY